MLGKQKNKDNFLFNFKKSNKQSMPKSGRSCYDQSLLWFKILFRRFLIFKKRKIKWHKILGFSISIIVTIFCLVNFVFGVNPLKIFASINSGRMNSEFVNLYA